MVRPSKNPAHAMRRVEEAVKPGDDPAGRGDQQDDDWSQPKEHEQHEPPSR